MSKKRYSNPLIVEAIEPRIMYSADSPLALAGALAMPLGNGDGNNGISVAVDTASLTRSVVATASEQQTQQRHEVVFIDGAVAHAQDLAASIAAESSDARSLEVYVIDPNENGIDRISDILSQQHDLNAVHIISHGDAGMLQIGDTRLDEQSTLTHAVSISKWGSALTGDGDILLYGCDLAQNQAGRDLVSALGQLTGADIAASTDLTGAASQGGDWTLEYATGHIETAVAPDAAVQAGFHGVLATYTVTNTSDSGAGSLRQAITDANANAGTDTIAFSMSGAQTIAPTSALPNITDTVILDGTTESGYTSTPLIEINGISAGNADGLGINSTATGSTIKGLLINRFTYAGISVHGASNITIQGNFVGTDATGTIAQGNGTQGILVDTGSSNVTIGGTTAAARNLVSGNAEGIDVVSSSGTTILGNYIGTNAAGTAVVGNTNVGIGLYSSTNTIVGGTTAAARNVIDGSTEGINNNATGTVIEGNYIGLNAAGTATLGNTDAGVYLYGSSTGTYVGGSAIGAGNVLSGNKYGVVIDGGNVAGNVTGNFVQGNYIGTNPDGSAALGQTFSGIFLTSAANGNTIGGTTAGERNIISGNTDGIEITTSDSNTIEGNYIGTDATGTTAIANANKGIRINSGNNNVIGGTAAGAGNLISGNTNYGIAASGGTGNTILGNYIGTEVTATSALANGKDGIYLNAATNTVIGGAAAGAGNVIAASGTGWEGVGIENSSGTLVQGNYIGTNSSGTNLGNDYGVYLYGGASNSTIGGTAAGAGNTIAYNRHGIATWTDATVTGNSFLGNKIYQNVSVGIDLGDNGTTFNDAGDVDTGANELQNFAVLSGAFINGVNVTMMGSLNSSASTNYRIEFFANSTVNSQSYSQGQRYLGSANVTTDASGNVSFNTILSASVSAGEWITATATNLTTNSTSEFSQAIAASNWSGTIGTQYIVTNTNDSGAGSLRQAILDANANTGLDTIIFNISSGAQTISPTSTLPTVTDSVIINARTQPGYASTPLIELNGASGGGAGLTLGSGSSDSTIKGFVINRFAGQGVYVNGASNVTIVGNYIGTDATGAIAQANGWSGIEFSSTSSGNTVGGGTTADRNILSGNTERGIFLNGSGSNLVMGNYVGTNAAGTGIIANGWSGIEVSTSNNNTIGGGLTANGGNLVYGNNQNGILVENSTGNTIGGTASGAGNTVSANTHDGISLNGSTNNTVAGNYVGTNIAGTAAAANGWNGIELSSANSNMVGGSSASARNVISGNANRGVLVYSSTGNTIVGNYIGLDAAGSGAIANSWSGIEFGGTASANTIGGTTAGERNIISGNHERGIYLNDAGSNAITGNYIGLDVTGVSAVANGYSGIELGAATTGNVIGGTTTGERNIISGNAQRGILMSASTGNTASGNYVGLNATGTAAVANVGNGIELYNATSNAIGGTAVGAGNVIAGNGRDGLDINAGSGNSVLGNYIGLNAAGTTAVANTYNAIRIENGTISNTVGGTTAGARNVLSGNGQDGVLIDGATSTGNTLLGNYIGTDAAGTVAVANGWNGVVLNSATFNTVGGSVSGAGNLISGNTQNGVSLQSAGNNNTIQGNYVGVDVTGAIGLGNSWSGIAIQDSNNNTIGGTTSYTRNIVSGNSSQGVSIQGITSTGNLVEGNYIGIDVTGTAAIGNGYNGVELEGTANTIGGAASGAGNVISGNTQRGINISSGVNNLVEGNYIGLNAAGTAAVANAGNGITLTNASGNTIGGTSTGDRNIISGNGDRGVDLDGSTGNFIQGNYIGTDATGTTAIGNTTDGIAVLNSANNNTIGGNTAGAGNLISGNGINGVFIDSNSSGNSVSGNYIGTNAAGNAAVANASNGIYIRNASNNTTIGGVATAERNIISGNGINGIQINGSSGTTVTGNYIGTDAAGSSALGNTGSGVYLHNGATATLIGGTAAGSGNLIVNNGGNGVTLTGATTTGNRILGNTIHTNGSLGIDFENDGVTANDAGDGDTGANNHQNFPVIATAYVTGANITVAGTLNSTASRTYRLEFFANDLKDGSGNGEGQIYLGFVDVTTDGSGNASFSFTGTGASVGQWISATATDATTNDTSEFGADVQALANNAPVITSNGGGASAAVSIYENSTAVTTVTSTDSDGDTPAYSITGGNDAAKFTVNAATGVLAFVTAPNYEAPGDANADNIYDVIVTASDGKGGSDAQTISVTVQNVNEAPSGTDNTVTTNEDTPYAFTAADFGFSDTADSPANAFQSVYITTLPGAGTLTWKGATFAAGNYVWRSDIDAGLLVFTPAANANGTGYTSFTFQVQDNGGTANGGQDTDQSANTMTINVTPVNDAPSGSDKTVTTNQDTSYTLTAADFGFSDVNDSPANNFSAVEITNLLGSGSLTNNSVAVNTGDFITRANIDAGKLVFTPLAGGHGDAYASFDFQVQDDGGTANGGVNLDQSVNTMTLNVTATDNTAQATYIVTNTNDSGAGSLRQALLNANTTTGDDTIVFNIGSGAQTIAPASALPTIAGVVTVDGSSQPGYAGSPLITLSGAAAGATSCGLNLTAAASGSTIEGLVISGFGENGIKLDGASNVTIQGNYIGTNAAGTAAATNGYNGIYLTNSASNNTIGGSTSTTRNVLSGNSYNGIQIDSGTGNVIDGNYIGLNAAGTASIANTLSGVFLKNIDTTIIQGGAVISGNTQNGISLYGASNITIQGAYIGTNAAGTAAVANGNHGIYLAGNASNNTIGGSTATTRNIISGNTQFGIQIDSGTGNAIDGNYIGLNAAGTAAVANAWSGIFLNGVSNNTIDGVVISGNGDNGILISAGGSNTIIGNYIGLNAAGSGSVSNASNGIYMYSASTGNIIGGTSASERNVISGNGAQGMEIHASTGTIIEGNYIGTNAAGTAAVANGGTGVKLEAGANNGTIGGTAAGAGNLISGNNSSGIEIWDSTGNTVLGNQVGTDAAGTGALGNGSVGLGLYNAGNSTVGGSVAGAANTISANAHDGINIENSTGLSIQGNYLGTNAAGDALGNGYQGIFFYTGAANNTIGGTAAGEGNVIAYNGYNGISTGGTSVTGNSFLGNTVYANGYLGIDLEGTGVSVNDAGDADTGANNLQNFPVLSSVTATATTTTFIGTLNSNVSKNYRIEFFSNTAVDGSGYGEGQHYLGYVLVTTDGSGNASFNTTLSIASIRGEWVSATATDLTTGDTSEFGQSIQIPINHAPAGTDATVATQEDTAYTFTAADFGFTDTSDSPADNFSAVKISNLLGSGSLTNNSSAVSAGDVITKAEIDAGKLIFTPLAGGHGDVYASFDFQVQDDGGTANSGVNLDPSANTMTLNVTATDSAAQATYIVTNTNDSGAGSLRQALLNANTTTGDDTIVFNIGSGAQTIAPASALPTIAGVVTVDGSSQPGYAGSPLITLSGAVAGATSCGLNLTAAASGSTIEGLVISGFGENGIKLDGASNVTIQGNYIGTNAAGTAAATNGYNGIYLTNSASNNTIGGSTSTTRNVLSGNSYNGIQIDSGTGNVIDGNYIGLNAAGTASIANTLSGVFLKNIDTTIIQDGAVISGNTQNGISLYGASNITIQGAYIGTNAAGTAAVANGNHGIYLAGNASNNTIGGSTATTRNIISGNTQFGIQIDSGTGNAIDGNYIGLNAAGTAAVANAWSGIFLNGVSNNTIDGAVISGNGGNGMLISAGGSNTIIGNYIGLNAAGSGSVSNASNGIYMYSASTGNIIGGTSASERNVISGNGAQGMEIHASTGTIIEGNYIGTNAAGTAAVANGGTGVKLEAGANNGTIGGTAAGAGNLISGNRGQGIEINGSTGAIIEGNYIGTDAAGTAAIANNDGIYIDGAATGNTVGGMITAARNLISGNAASGVDIENCDGNTVIGNYIGVDVTGLAALGNGDSGIFIYASNNNIIGGADSGAGNVISGNSTTWLDGISIYGSSGNTIAGNYVGTDATGSAVIGNGRYGIYLDATTSGTTIGGIAAGSKNVISGNTSDGIAVDGAIGNSILGNYIGTDVNGGTALGNGHAGIYVFGGAANTTIGGSSLADRNIISGNAGNGIQISAASSTSILNNYIGTDVTGTVSLGNTSAGIFLDLSSTNNNVGGINTGEGNVVAYNGGKGIYSAASSTISGNAFLGNSIFSNAGMGIDLANDGVTVNDAGDGDTGANNLQNFPLITSATSTGSTVTIAGTFNSTASHTFRLEFFASTSADGTGYGGGERYLGFVSVSTDGSGNATFNTTLTAATTRGEWVGATATDQTTNETSEFGQSVLIPINHAPAGTDTTVTALEDNAYTFVAADFGFADTGDSAADNFAAVKITTVPVAGTLTNSGVTVNAGDSITKAELDGGKLVFTPAANANGAGYASFTFQVQDDGGTANGGANLDPSANTLTIDVTSVNDAPSGTDITVTTNEDVAYTFTAADFGFSDASDTPANAFSAVTITTVPVAGTLTNNGVTVNAGDSITKAELDGGKLVFTPAANANGAGYASFTFQVQDDGGTANGGVNLDLSANTLTIDVTSVNDAPSGTDTTVTTNEDAAYTFTAADFGFADASDSPANAFSAVTITTVPVTGTLTNNGVTVNAGDSITKAELDGGKLVFTPAANANGAGYASFTFQVQDDGGTANGGANLDLSANTLTIDVTSVNDAPSGTDTTVTTNEDAAYAFTAADFGFSDALDSPANALSAVTITTVPVAGTLTNNGVTVNAGDSITKAELDGGKLVFTPAANANGTGYASFTFQVQDDGGTANGGANLDPSANTLTIDVTLVNDAPSGTDTTVTTNEDTAYTFTAADFGFADASDSPANAFSAVTITTVPVAGTLTNNGVTVNAGDSITKAELDGGKLVFTPAANANGAGYANFTFQVQDDGGTANGGANLDLSANTLTIDVTSVNDAPSGTDTTVTTNEDAAYAFTAADFGFADASDSPANAFSAVTITTVPVAGTLTNNGVTVNAGDSITKAELDGGKLVFTPAANANGTGYASFTFQVQDDGGTANGGANLDLSANTLTIDVTSVNDAPSGTDTTVMTNEDAAYAFTAADFGFSDALDSPANALSAVTITTVPVAGTLTNNGVTVNAGDSITKAELDGGKLVFTPAANANGAGYASFTFQVQDDGGTANGGANLDPSANTLTIDVTSVNDAPSGTDTTVTTNEDTAYTFTAADFGFNDAIDTPANAFSAVTITTVPVAGTLANNGVTVNAGASITKAELDGGKLVFTPAANANGTGYASFTFQVQDDGGIANGGQDTDPSANTLTIDVRSVNDAPSGTDTTVMTAADGSHVFTAADFGFADASDTPANNFLAVKFDNVLAVGTLKNNGAVVNDGDTVTKADIAAGKLVFTPAANIHGAMYVNFTFQVQDDGGTANGGMDTSTVARTITIGVTVPGNDIGNVTDGGTSVDGTPAKSDKAAPTKKDTGSVTDASIFYNYAPGNSANGAVTNTASQSRKDGGSVAAGASSSGAIENIGFVRVASATHTVLVPVVRTSVAQGDAQESAAISGKRVSVITMNQLELLHKYDWMKQTMMSTIMTTSSPDDGDSYVARSVAQENNGNKNVGITTAQAIEVAGAVMSLGTLGLLARKGALAASLLASFPAWTRLDPLPVLGDADTDGGALDSPQDIADHMFSDSKRLPDGESEEERE